MESTSDMEPVFKLAFWVGIIISLMCAFFLLIDGAMKAIKVAKVIEMSAQMGFSADVIQCIGIILIVCTVLYLIPQTSILGAILLTGYLGGAIATNIHTPSPSFPIVLASTFGVLVWLGLFLRDKRLWALIPIRWHGPSQ